jgi:hypothetical protein
MVHVVKFFSNFDSLMADTDDELKRAEEHKAKGNALFGQERFAEAAEEYSAAIDIVRSC